MGVDVPEARRDDESFGIDDARRAFVDVAEGDDLAACDCQVAAVGGLSCPIDDEPTADQRVDRHCASLAPPTSAVR